MASWRRRRPLSSGRRRPVAAGRPDLPQNGKIHNSLGVGGAAERRSLSLHLTSLHSIRLQPPLDLFFVNINVNETLRTFSVDRPVRLLFISSGYHPL